jgi:hypothetical protein
MTNINKFIKTAVELTIAELKEIEVLKWKY